MEIDRCRRVRIRPSPEADRLFQDCASAPIRQPVSLAELLKRPELHYGILAALDGQRPELTAAEQYAVEVQLKYEGYIRLEEERIGHFRKTERRLLPNTIDYSRIKGLRLEARQKLDKMKPASVGQASRISGVSPADISVLLVYLQTLPGRRGKRGRRT